VLAREHQALVSDYAHFRHINRQKLDTLYSRLYLFDRSMLGKVLKVLEKLYFIVRLKPRSKSYLRHQISEAKQYISDNEVNPADFAESYSRLRLVLKVLRFSIQHPFSTLRIANKQRLKKLAKSILSDDSVQAYKWIDSRLPSPGKKPLPDTVTNDNSLESLELSFPVFSAMQVSIIVPVFNQYRTTVSCLKSVLDHTTSINYEVIVADDCSDDATQSIEDRVKNITVVRGEQNQGFLKNCNNAVTHASGEYVVLLNNDTNVQDGWLSALVDVMETRPDTGLVGPKLLFENGILQEAGGIIWQDASGWNYGRGQNPELPEFNYLRETDYISGACILFRKSIWDELGGFDERFYPAYYEDTDLAFQMREKGLKVMYQPASEVVHFEGVSNGSDLNSGIKKHQLLNQKVFKEKWAERLATDHFPNAENVFQARERSKGKRTIVVIDHYVPFYDQDAGSRSTYLYVKSMAEAGLNVKFLPANFYPHRPYTNTLEQLGIEVLYGETHARDWKKWFRENAQYIDVVYLHRPHITEDFVDELNTLNPRPRLIYFGHDLHYLRTQREAEVLGDSDLRVESEEWKKRELAIFGKVDKVYYPSQVEVDEVKRISPETNVMAIPLYLLDKPDPADYRHEERRGLLFVGGFGHAPNEDAVIWFTSKVMPQLVEADPSICLHIVGSRVPESVQSLASDNILVHGFVSDEDLQTLYREARLCIVPLRYGAGVKGKVLEALQAGIPIVTTTIGAEGLPEAETVMAIANKAPKMIEETLSLYNSPEQCSKYLTRYPDYIERNFSQKEVQRVIERDFLN
jgi:GT2 family glycosyltransferase